LRALKDTMGSLYKSRACVELITLTLSINAVIIITLFRETLQKCLHTKKSILSHS
jgi:hypothetical protein